MKGRPKLVEEGSPLMAAPNLKGPGNRVQPANNGDHNDDKSNGNGSKPVKRSSLRTAMAKSPHVEENVSQRSAGGAAVLSSLQRAAAQAPGAVLTMKQTTVPQKQFRRNSGKGSGVVHKTPSPYSVAYTVGGAPPSVAPLDASAPAFVPHPEPTVSNMHVDATPDQQPKPNVKKISPASFLPSYWSSAPPPTTPAMEESSSSSNDDPMHMETVDAEHKNTYTRQHSDPLSDAHKSHPNTTNRSQSNIETSHEIGAPHDLDVVDDTFARMEGVDVDDPLRRMPLVVLDGANIAYAYATAVHGEGVKLQPDVSGIRVASEYFMKAGLRVRVVLPASWMRRKPKAGDHDQGNASMVTPDMELLQDLHQQNILVPSPPKGDDDAYCLILARRETARMQQDETKCGTGFVVSNDHFRDAVARGDDAHLSEWLNRGVAPAADDASPRNLGPGRIGYTFCDVGTRDDYGDKHFDFVPNPRHDLVIWVEQQLKEQ